MPVLWDKELRCIVSNDSWAIVKMLATSFAPLGATPRALSPAALAPQIDARHAAIYQRLLNGVYVAGISLLQQHEDRRTAAEVGTRHDHAHLPRPPRPPPPPAPPPALLPSTCPSSVFSATAAS